MNVLTCDDPRHTHLSLADARVCAVTTCDDSTHTHDSLDSARQCAADQVQS